MPFIFPPSSDDSGETSTPIEPSNHRVLKGRRTFNGDGKEVVPEVVSKYLTISYTDHESCHLRF